MGKTIKKKLHSRKGFTLAETLLAVLILLMVSGIVASGIPTAINAYEKVVLTSNAKVLLSTTISTLRNELGAGQDIEIATADAGNSEKTGTVVTYYNATRDASSKIYVKDGNVPQIMFRRYYSADELSADYTPEPLISSATATADLYVTYESVTYDKTTGIIKFTNLAVMRESGTNALATRSQISIRTILY